MSIGQAEHSLTQILDDLFLRHGRVRLVGLAEGDDRSAGQQEVAEHVVDLRRALDPDGHDRCLGALGDQADACLKLTKLTYLSLEPAFGEKADHFAALERSYDRSYVGKVASINVEHYRLGSIPYKVQDPEAI